MTNISSNTEPIIRTADPEDLDAIMELLIPFMNAQRLLLRTREQVSSLLPTAFVSVLDDTVVGFATIEIYSNKLAEIQCLAVREIHQGKGIGKLLIKSCLDTAKRHGVLEVMAISASDQFLKRCGFDYSLPGQKRALFYNTQHN
ncbi:MAG: GNAT family N-acetyltransferase [Planctomycetota bacterium]|nr:GNAT family N-acetyltransferase [Planctomycetota bacterium]